MRVDRGPQRLAAHQPHHPRPGLRPRLPGLRRRPQGRVLPGSRLREARRLLRGGGRREAPWSPVPAPPPQVPPGDQLRRRDRLYEAPPRPVAHHQRSVRRQDGGWRLHRRGHEAGRAPPCHRRQLHRPVQGGDGNVP